jgi:hypothetical protein
MTTKQKIETAEKIVAAGFAGCVWCKRPDVEGAAVRIYASNGNGYMDITDAGANIDGIKRGSFDAAKAACIKAGVTATR